ncbi:MAG: hemerythrin domain-containing protein [Rhodospirillales bacterium]|nr:hemerythrin domain-containing protein [Rhodospirillales bacterium]
MMAETHIAAELHAEHMATLALLGRLDALLGRNGPENPPEAASPPVAALLRDFANAVTREIATHFGFEENALFPLLDQPAMTALLIEEHAALLPMARDLAARARGFDPAGWAGFHADAAALSTALAAHVEKEEMGLLPALDDALDAETDARLSMDYAAQR